MWDGFWDLVKKLDLLRVQSPAEVLERAEMLVREIGASVVATAESAAGAGAPADPCGSGSSQTPLPDETPLLHLLVDVSLFAVQGLRSRTVPSDAWALHVLATAMSAQGEAALDQWVEE